jgi:hypothetical protein
MIERWWVGDRALSPTLKDDLEAARRFLFREPERGRRFLRLLCAQYLAHAETRELPPLKPPVWAKLTLTQGTFKVPLYPVSPDAPAGARALPSQGPARWQIATLDARLRIRDDELPWPTNRKLRRALQSDDTNGTSLRAWWPVTSRMQGGEGAQLRAVQQSPGASDSWPRAAPSACDGSMRLLLSGHAYRSHW